MSQSPKEKEDSDISFVLIALIVAILIIGLWLTNLLVLIDEPETKRGTLGDMFGTVNALFSGLALAGIILTILLQRKELKLQREELRDTRTEFETQNKTLKLQRFENTFFNILNLHHQIISGMDVQFQRNVYKTDLGYVVDGKLRKQEREAVTNTGRDVFRYWYNIIASEIKGKPDEYERIYLKYYDQGQTDFGHYFRNLYRMIKLVDETDFFYDDRKVSKSEIFALKYRYTSIIRSQLSNYELALTFYNCLTENGREKFKPLIERYSLFKNIPERLLANHEHMNLYQPTAYSPQNN